MFVHGRCEEQVIYSSCKSGDRVRHLVSWLSATELSRYLPLKISFRDVKQDGVRPPTAPYVGYK
jgi:hypothetical protein